MVTVDALLTQREIAQPIVDSGGDYVMPVKENQRQLLGDLVTALASPPPAATRPGGWRAVGMRATDAENSGA